MPRMPDSRIASSIGGGTQTSPFQTLGAMMQIKEQQLVHQARQREADDNNALQTALTTHERPDEAIDDLWKQGRSGVASTLAKQVYSDRALKAEVYDREITGQSKALEMASQILHSATDETSFQTARKAAGAILEPKFGKGVWDQMGATYDKDRVKQLVDWGTSRGQQLNTEHNSAQLLLQAWRDGQQPDASGNWSPNGQKMLQGQRDAVANAYEGAGNQQQWDAYRSTFIKNGIKNDMLAETGSWSDDPKERARRAKVLRDQGLDAKQRADIDHQKVSERQAEDRLDKDGSGGSGRGSTLTETAKSESRTRRNKKNDEIEEWALKTFEEESEASADGKPKPFYVGGMSAASQDQYRKRRLQNEDNHRNELGDPSMEEAGARAAAAGDTAGYEKIRKQYNSLTQGVGAQFESLVKPPVTRETRLARVEQLNTAMETERNPQKRAAIQKELQALLAVGPASRPATPVSR